MIDVLTIPLLTFVVCLVLHAVALQIFPKIGLLDFPERYGLTRKAIPYPTGILAIIVFLNVFVLTTPWTAQVAGVVLGIVTLGIISFIDDRKGVHPTLRLGIQILIAFGIFATGSRIYTLTNPLLADGILSLDSIDIPLSLPGTPYPILLPLWSGIFTIAWLTLTMNALNWFDGIPGQVSTLSTIAFFVIGFLSLSSRVDQPEVALIALTLGGISLACLLFDFPPNNVLMGDTGAMFFGLMLGVLTMYAGGKVATAFLVLGVPLIDVFLVITRRIVRGKNPMKGSATDEHLHHRLLQKGWSERQIIILTASLGSLFGITALFLSTTEKLMAAVVLFGVMLGLSFYSSTSRKAASDKR